MCAEHCDRTWATTVNLMQLSWRKRRVNRPELMVLCDVSGSVVPYAAFLLLLLHSLTEVVPRLRSFAFSSHLGEVTDYFPIWILMPRSPRP